MGFESSFVAACLVLGRGERFGWGLLGVCVGCGITVGFGGLYAYMLVLVGGACAPVRLGGKRGFCLCRGGFCRGAAVYGCVLWSIWSPVACIVLHEQECMLVPVCRKGLLIV